MTNKIVILSLDTKFCSFKSITSWLTQTIVQMNTYCLKSTWWFLYGASSSPEQSIFLFNISEINNFVFAKYNSYFVLKIVHIELGGGVERERWGIWGNVGEDAGQFYMFCLPRVRIPPGTKYLFKSTINFKFFLVTLLRIVFVWLHQTKTGGVIKYMLLLV